MWNKILVVSFLLAVWVSLPAAEFNVTILSYPRNVPLGVPIYITYEARNTSGHAITVARGFTGFRLRVYVRRNDGETRQVCPPEIVGQISPGFEKDVLPADWSWTRTEYITCEDASALKQAARLGNMSLTSHQAAGELGVGEFGVQVVLSSRGPYFTFRDPDKTPFEAWSGEVKSEEIRIEITEPMGLDRDAFQTFHGQPLSHPKELLQRFPTSTYAAWELWGQGYVEFQSTDTTPSSAENDYHWGEEAKEEYSKCPNCQCEHKRWLCLVIPPWETLYQQFPGFMPRQKLLYNLSRAYFLIGQPGKAVPLIQELLSKFPESTPGKQAVAYRDVLKAHGLWPE